MRTLLPLLLAFCAPALRAAPASLTVQAGKLDRTHSVVAFALPAPLITTAHTLVSSNGTTLALQVDASGRARFILPSLPAGQSTTFEIASTPMVPLPQGITVEPVGTALRATGPDEKVILQYQGGKSALPRPNIKPILHRGGYLHPILSPSGKLVSDDYPANHPHHHGLWFAWTKTEFEGRHPDFWNMGDGSGTVIFKEIQSRWSGAVHGGWRAEHQYIDLKSPSPKPVLNETWEVTVYQPATGTRPYYLFDLVSTQTCASGTPLKLPEYHYGGLGFRGNWAWNGPQNTFFLTSSGETNRLQGNATRGRWCHVGGMVEGGLTGVTLLCHPNNLRFPQPMRLNPTEPFFCFAPSQLGDWEITPQAPFVSRYRMVVMDGAPDAAELERLWRDYADPVQVTVAF